MVKSFFYGTLASVILLAVYFGVLFFVSGWIFAKNQFSDFWYFIVSLAIGFGVQVGLYVYLNNLIKGVKGTTGIIGITGTTSTAAMISCCSHYLVNLLPILGMIDVATFVSQYQIQLFWVGLLFNLGGIGYITSKIIKYKKT